jgi:hypothetical protein
MGGRSRFGRRFERGFAALIIIQKRGEDVRQSDLKPRPTSHALMQGRVGFAFVVSHPFRDEPADRMGYLRGFVLLHKICVLSMIFRRPNNHLIP